MVLQYLLFCILGVLFQPYANASDVVVAQNGKSFTIYAPQSRSGSKSNALVIGVGTGMSTMDYSTISTVLVQNLGNFIVAIVDSNPGSIDKTNGSKFGTVFAAVDTWLSTNNIEISSWLVGGHSASGMACAEALSKALLHPRSGSIVGFVGFDPYQYKSKPAVYNLPIASTIWTMSHGGFLQMLQYCIPDLNESGKGFHEHASSPSGTCSQHGLYTFTDTTSHCVFANYNCLGLCGSSGSVSRNVTYTNIATSISQFLQGAMDQFSANPFSNVVFSTRQACSN